jgi:hypothetical protein
MASARRDFPSNRCDRGHAIPHDVTNFRSSSNTGTARSGVRHGDQTSDWLAGVRADEVIE